MNKAKIIALENECDQYKKELKDKNDTVLHLENELEKNLKDVSNYGDLVKQNEKLKEEKESIKQELESNNAVNVALNGILDSQYEQINSLELQIKEFTRRP